MPGRQCWDEYAGMSCINQSLSMLNGHGLVLQFVAHSLISMHCRYIYDNVIHLAYHESLSSIVSIILARRQILMLAEFDAALWSCLNLDYITQHLLHLIINAHSRCVVSWQMATLKGVSLGDRTSMPKDTSQHFAISWYRLCRYIIHSKSCCSSKAVLHMLSSKA